MAYIKVEVDYPIEDGMSLTLKAPCDSTAVTGLKVYYPVMTESESTPTSKVFSFKDAHNNALTSVGNLFTQNAYIKVILNVTNGAAFIQNQDTNKYLEDKFTNTLSDAKSYVDMKTSPITFTVNKFPGEDGNKIHVTGFPSYTTNTYSLMLSGQKFLVRFQYDEQDLAICEAFASGIGKNIYCQVPPNVKQYYSGNYLQLHVSGTSWLPSLET